MRNTFIWLLPKSCTHHCNFESFLHIMFLKYIVYICWTIRFFLNVASFFCWASEHCWKNGSSTHVVYAKKNGHNMKCVINILVHSKPNCYQSETRQHVDASPILILPHKGASHEPIIVHRVNHSIIWLLSNSLSLLGVKRSNMASKKSIVIIHYLFCSHCCAKQVYLLCSVVLSSVVLLKWATTIFK